MHAKVQTTMNCLADRDSKPVSYAYQPPEGTPVRSWRVSKHPTTIHNARPIEDRLSLDRQGFMLVHHHSTVTNFYDDAEVKSVYYPEIERLVKEASGAVRVVAFDHNVRCGPMAKQVKKACVSRSATRTTITRQSPGGSACATCYPTKPR
jgi:hypothetical protein